MSKNISRRVFLKASGLSAVGALLAACAPQVVTQVVQQTAAVVMQTSVVKETQMVEATKIVEITSTPQMGPTNALGVVLPPDALPMDQQFLLIPLAAVGTQLAGATGHEMESVYNKAYNHGLGSEPLTALDKEGAIVGISCESWKQSDDGLNWDFTLRKGLTFSDGGSVTAKDWVYTFQRSFGKGYDFGWMFADMLNANDVLAGKKDPTTLGIQAVDDYTLRVVTAARTPYIPAVMIWAYCAPKQAYDKYGDTWSVEPAHFITNGPWLLTEFERGVKWTFALNPKYTGIVRPMVAEIRGRTLPNTLGAYINGEIHQYSLSTSTPAGEIGMVNGNPVLRAESHPGFANVTSYIGFNTLGKFKELADAKVRLALNKALDKTTMVGALGQGFAFPAWGILPKGFIGNNYVALAQEDPNVFDLAAAQKLLSDAGFPKGQGFPTFELYMRAPDAATTSICEAIQAAWKKNLGINVKLVPADYPTFTKNVFTDKVIPMYFVAYSLDYWDPVTFLNVFKTGSRHPWANKAFDDAIVAANALADQKARFAGLNAAEKILVDDCGFAFWACSFAINLWPCNAAGGWTIPNSLGYAGLDASPYSGGPNEYNDFYWTKSTCRAGLKS